MKHVGLILSKISMKEDIKCPQFSLLLIRKTKHVFHVGCAADPEKSINPLPAPVARKKAEIAPDIPQLVILQSEEVSSLEDWVKW